MNMSWSTRQIAPARRAEFWRGAVCDAFLAMTPRIAAGDDFDARLEHTSFDRLAFNRVLAPAHGVMRTPHDLARGGPRYLFLNLNRSGRGRVRQFGREHLGAAGELMLIDSSEPYAIELVDGGELLSLALPIEWLAGAAPTLQDAIARPLPATPAGCMLRSQIGALAACLGDGSDPLDPLQAGVLADVLLALTAVALSPSAGPVQGVGLTRRLRALIARHHHDAGFDPAQAARLAGVSLRSVHAAFAHEGSSFGRELMEYRLQRAQQRLAAAGLHVRVAGVAADCGFRSAEHFSRRFRARFGITPEGCRAQSAPAGRPAPVAAR